MPLCSVALLFEIEFLTHLQLLQLAELSVIYHN